MKTIRMNEYHIYAEFDGDYDISFEEHTQDYQEALYFYHKIKDMARAELNTRNFKNMHKINCKVYLDKDLLKFKSPFDFDNNIYEIEKTITIYSKEINQ